MDQKTLKEMIEFRHELHQYPEISFMQFETRERIKKKLKTLGVLQSQWKEMAKTALVVDLKGLAQPQGKDRCVAFRADMDALQMTQQNPQLQYKSKNQLAAHMCGHDGHMTCLIAFVPLFMKHRPNIPKNKVIRLLFQPSEQGPKSGAKLMIQQGCLQGVDQVYGFHNWPTAPLGELWCQEGPVMAQITVLNIKVIGTGGHGSSPQTLKVAIWQAVALYTKIKDYLDALQHEKPGKFVCTLPVFKSGQRFNVIADSAFISGTIRSFEQGLSKQITDKIRQFLQDLKSNGFQYEFDSDINAPILINTKLEAENVLRVGERLFGKQKVSSGKLPFKASEDFAFYTRFKPGAFFFLSTSRNQPQPPMIHNANFDFNDGLIQKAAIFWLMLAQDRFQISLGLK